MGPIDALISDFVDVERGYIECNVADVDTFKNQVDEISLKVDELEQKLNEVEQFYSATSKKQPNTYKGSSAVKHKDTEKHVPSTKKPQQDVLHREADAAKRMQDLMRQLGTILRQITQHKSAWPFLEPVDADALNLHDYHEIIDNPMDLGTIKDRMDGNGYKNVREICADVRLVFKNALKYNEEKSEVHTMAKTVLAKFEEKWLKILPKVTEEEKRLEKEDAEAQLSKQVAHEAAHAKMATNISDHLYAFDNRLEDLREIILQNCRKMSSVEKRELCTSLTRLCPEDLSKALEIVAQSNPSFQATTEEVDLDIDAQSESTLWRLKFFVKDVLVAVDKTAKNNTGANTAVPATTTNNKRKREICHAIAKTAKKKM